MSASPVGGRRLRLAVTGNEGQIALALAERDDIDCIRVGRPALDLLRPETILPALAGARPDIVVSAAAYTAVDQAEQEADVAMAVNGAGAGAVAEAARRLGVPVIQLSTDYVFAGEGARPWREDDPVGPLSSYGRSKLAGEKAVRQAAPDHAILRVAWVYSPFGKNFVKTMLRLAGERDTVTVVADQHGAPSCAGDLAAAIVAVAANLVARPDDGTLRGTFHLAPQGTASWADFAEEIFAISAGLGGPSAQVTRIATKDYPTPARRPLYSVLDSSRIAAAHGIVLPHWRAAVRPCIERLLTA